MLKYYIGTRLENWREHNAIRNVLGVDRITYDWTKHGSVKEGKISVLKLVCRLECQGVIDADLMLCVLPGGRGTHVELGIALAKKVPVMIYSPDPKSFQCCEETSAFYHHSHVILKTTSLNDLIKEATIFLGIE